MTRFRAGCAALLAPGVAACADSSHEPVAPDARADAGFFANGSDDDQDDFSERRNIANTEVAMFGGGKIPSPALNKGLVVAPECPGSTDIPPGGSVQVSGLAVGNHRFQCCIHPWMRALIKVKPGYHGEH